jgi:hypothetical protein
MLDHLSEPNQILMGIEAEMHEEVHLLRNPLGSSASGAKLRSQNSTYPWSPGLLVKILPVTCVLHLSHLCPLYPGK